MIRCLLAALLIATCLPGVLAASGPAAYDLQVDLSFTGPSGDEGMREELELQMLSELRRVACFRSVVRAAPTDAGERDGDAPAWETLHLNIAVSEIFEETVYDTSIAQRSDPRAPQELELLHTSRIYAVMEVTLEHRASGVELRSKKLRGAGAHRPLTPGEDARHTALREATIEAAMAVRRFVCKVGAKRLYKEIGPAPSR